MRVLLHHVKVGEPRNLGLTKWGNPPILVMCTVGVVVVLLVLLGVRPAKD